MRLHHCFLTAVLFILAVVPAWGAEPSSAGRDNLSSQFRRLEPQLAKKPFGMPVVLESVEGGSASGVDIYGIVDYPMETVQKELQRPARWCDITLLHTNVRACTVRQQGNATLMTLHMVKKNTQPLKSASPMQYTYRTATGTSDYFEVSMTAEDGPYGTSNHRFLCRAVPLNGSRTFIHLSYTYQYSTLGYVAMKSYFALFSRSHVGFSIAGTDADKKPVYVKGLRGAIERNIMRYYLGIPALFDTLKFPPEEQFEKRINRWYDLTERNRRQLHAMERKDYLMHKRQDQKNRLRLQAGQQ